MGVTILSMKARGSLSAADCTEVGTAALNRMEVAGAAVRML